MKVWIEPEVLFPMGSADAQIIESLEQVWREAIDLGKASGTKDGAAVVNKAKQYLAELLESKETS